MFAVFLLIGVEMFGAFVLYEIFEYRIGISDILLFILAVVVLALVLVRPWSHRTTVDKKQSNDR
ncbi:MAG: hypothetical protein A3H76_03840 [Candidatus Lloydbacteria bacterium RIFCSPLOWO2_02_FULL_54_12]|nr:MAG: hypothetical protein A3H76_03840 [Candidatus Lloydbacteria bacterium RIFCSPLOWO2_02_FULL_54_12]